MITTAIGLLGFSCDKEKQRRDEYGTPTASYIIIGTVCDSTTTVPVPNVRLSTLSYDTPQLSYHPDHNTRDYTGTSGQFVLKTGQIFAYQQIPVEVFDPDGRYRTDTLYVSFEGVTFMNPSRWYQGEESRHISVKVRHIDPDHPEEMIQTE